MVKKDITKCYISFIPCKWFFSSFYDYIMIMQSIFERHEKKYLVTKEQGAELQEIMSQYMKPDGFGEYLVQNLYYDTENWDVIRTSIEHEKPLYKEKMRLRCYDMPDKTSMIFLELKKKFQGIVYKRRMEIPFKKICYSSIRDIVSAGTSQISRELNFYIKKNAVLEKIYIAYKRIALIGKEQARLRITFDTDIHFRLDQLNYFNPDKGNIILGQDKVVMEIKTIGGMPLWLVQLLSENKIYPTSFSKYGRCYTDYIMKQTEKERGELLSA